jgi:hypothetical protein
MADETAESGAGFGTTVRAFAFDGDKVKYRSWEGKTLALTRSKGFLLALTRESTSTALTVEEFEYGEVEVMPATAATTGGGAATAAVMHPTTAAENRKYLARAGWTYLVMSCTNKAYALMERCKGDPYMAWSILPYYKNSTVPWMWNRITPNWIKHLATASSLECRRIQNFGSMTWTI